MKDFFIYTGCLIGFDGLVILQAYSSKLHGYWQRDRYWKFKSNRPFITFTEHGGMLLDFILLPPLVAWIVAHYRNNWKPSDLVLAGTVSFLITIYLHNDWRNRSIESDGPHYEDGKTQPAGWLHLLYMWPALAILILALFLTPNLSREFMNALISGLALHVAVGLVQPTYVMYKRMGTANIIYVFIAWILLAVRWYTFMHRH